MSSIRSAADFNELINAIAPIVAERVSNRPENMHKLLIHTGQALTPNPYAVVVDQQFVDALRAVVGDDIDAQYWTGVYLRRFSRAMHNELIRSIKSACPFSSSRALRAATTSTRASFLSQ